VQAAKVGPAGDIPHITESLIDKYVSDLQRLSLVD
jgi:fatty acid CoA ligase FadD9